MHLLIHNLFLHLELSPASDGGSNHSKVCASSSTSSTSLVSWAFELFDWLSPAHRSWFCYIFFQEAICFFLPPRIFHAFRISCAFPCYSVYRVVLQLILTSLYTGNSLNSVSILVSLVARQSLGLNEALLNYKQIPPLYPACLVSTIPITFCYICHVFSLSLPLGY